MSKNATTVIIPVIEECRRRDIKNIYRFGYSLRLLNYTENNGSRRRSRRSRRRTRRKRRADMQMTTDERCASPPRPGRVFTMSIKQDPKNRSVVFTSLIILLIRAYRIVLCLYTHLLAPVFIIIVIIIAVLYYHYYNIHIYV